MRFYDVDSGSISLDGVDTRTMTRRDLRARTGMVLQDSWLFGGTIFDNIAYGDPTASREEVIEAARAAHVDHFVSTLPDGYDTIIDEEGGGVSAGERQLITIARAFLARPTILILDEATSSVDTRTELLIQQAMAALRSDRTLLRHRPPPLDDPRRRHHRRDGEGPNRRAGHAQRAARGEGRLLPPVPEPVQRRPRLIPESPTGLRTLLPSKVTGMAINTELPEKLNSTVESAHLAAEHIFRPISRKYDKAEHEYPVELDEFAKLAKQAAERDRSETREKPAGEETVNGMNLRGVLSAAEMSWGDVGLMLSIPGRGLGNAAIAAVASPEQLERFGDVWASMAITRPSFGSDSAAVTTTATLDGDDYVINGEKIFVTSGSRASHVVVWRPWTARSAAPPSSPVVPMDTPGSPSHAWSTSSASRPPTPP